MAAWRRWGARPSRGCAAVRIATSCRRRASRARRAAAWAAGKGRGGGRPAAATWAKARASSASVLAHCPGACATSRAWRGWTTTTGRLAVASAAPTARGEPPGASRTRRVGGTAWRRATRAPISCASWATAQRSPGGRKALSSGAWATSLPTNTCGADLLTPHWPDLVRCGLWGTGPRGGLCEDEDVTPRAPLRSRWTCGWTV